MTKYMIGIDQSTQGTKALLFDKNARLIARTDEAHEQKINEQGHISHDPEEIFRNVKKAVSRLLSENSICPEQVSGIGISNQRETTVAWDKKAGTPFCDAVVWQCSRAEKICQKISQEDATYTLSATGLPLSPYFPAAKMSWILQHCPKAYRAAEAGRLCLGTIDSWLLFRMTDGRVFATDYSNASRTQLFHIHRLNWDPELCRIFKIPPTALPHVMDSDALFGETTLDDIFPYPVPIHAVLGDSHAALFAQNCRHAGQIKATYGTGSSVMMNTGRTPVLSSHGLSTSLAWKINGEISYVLEGNLNDTGAVITWLKNSLCLIRSAHETENLALTANPRDTTYLVPAFSGLGAPYWDSGARAVFCGMNRSTGKAELVKAALECIAYQITDLLEAMAKDSKICIENLYADGGATGNAYLMQFQSDIGGITVKVSENEELSGIGAACLAGIALGIYTEENIFLQRHYQEYTPSMLQNERELRRNGWKLAIEKSRTQKGPQM